MHFGGHERSKCLRVGNKVKWMAQAAECKTCGELSTPESDIEVSLKNITFE